MIKSSKNQGFNKVSKLKLNQDTLRIIGVREMVAVVGGASAGTSTTNTISWATSADIACCSN